MAKIDVEPLKKVFSFVLMGLSGLWANFLVRESIVKFSKSRAWKNLVGNLSLFCWFCAAVAIYYALKKSDISVFFRIMTLMFIIISLIVPRLSSISCREYTVFSGILLFLTVKFKLMGLMQARSIKRACFKSLSTEFIFMDTSILDIWTRAEKLFKEIKSISKRINSRFELSSHENTCLYMDNVRQELATHLVRVQHLYDFKRKNSRGPEKKSLLEMERRIKKSIEKTIKGLESMKARALIMEIGSISGLQRDTDCLNSSLELAEQAFNGLSLARLELDLEFDLDQQKIS